MGILCSNLWGIFWMDHFSSGLYFFEFFTNFVINTLSDIKPVMISFPCVDFLLPLNMSLSMQKLSFVRLNVEIVDFNFCTNRVLYFLLAASLFQVLDLSLIDPFEDCFCEKWQIRFELHSSTCGYRVSEHYLLKVLSFLQCLFLKSLSNIRGL